MPDDLDFADLRHGAQVLARAVPQQFPGVNIGHIQRRQLVGALARRGFLENQALVLIDVPRGFLDRAHRATSAGSGLRAPAAARASTSSTPSMAGRGVVS